MSALSPENRELVPAGEGWTGPAGSGTELEEERSGQPDSNPVLEPENREADDEEGAYNREHDRMMEQNGGKRLRSASRRRRRRGGKMSMRRHKKRSTVRRHTSRKHRAHKTRSRR